MKVKTGNRTGGRTAKKPMRRRVIDSRGRRVVGIWEQADDGQ